MVMILMPGHRLRVRFADDTEGEVDIASFIFAKDAGAFERLRDPLEFAQAYVDDGVVAWPGGLDLAPDAMYDDIKRVGHRVAGQPPVSNRR